MALPAGPTIVPPCSPTSSPLAEPVVLLDLVDADVLAAAWSVDLDWTLTHLRHRPLPRNPRSAPVVTIHPGVERRAQAWRRLFVPSIVGCRRTVVSRRRNSMLSWVVPTPLPGLATGLPIATLLDVSDFVVSSLRAWQHWCSTASVAPSRPRPPRHPFSVDDRRRRRRTMLRARRRRRAVNTALWARSDFSLALSGSPVLVC